LDALISLDPSNSIKIAPDSEHEIVSTVCCEWRNGSRLFELLTTLKRAWDSSRNISGPLFYLSHSSVTSVDDSGALSTLLCIWCFVPFRDNASQRGVSMNLNRDQKLSIGLVILFWPFPFWSCGLHWKARLPR